MTPLLNERKATKAATNPASRSRAYLKRSDATLTLRAAMVLTLWLGFWLLALGLILALSWLPFSQLRYQSSITFSGYIALFAAVSLVYALCPRWRWRNHERDKPALTPLTRLSAQPLYAMVERIARKLKIKASIDIHLMGAASAFISCERNWFGKVQHIRVGIGLPLLGTLSNAELGSVLAHEFGHLVAGDLSLGTWVYRTQKSLRMTVANLDDSLFFLDFIFQFYGLWVVRLSNHVLRAQEYSADAFAVRCFGVKPTRAALEKIHLIEPMWSAYLAHELSPAITRGSRLPVFEGFRRFCQPGIKRPEVQTSIDDAQVRPATKLDSHPSLADRVAAILPGATPGYPPLSDCLQLAGGELAAEDAWYAMFEHAELTCSNWDDYGTAILQAQIEQRFADSWMAPRLLALTELVGMTRQVDQLWDKLRPQEVCFLSMQGKRNHILEILQEWIIASLCHRGFTLKSPPGQVWTLERGQQSVSPAALLSAALDGKLRSAALQQFDLPEIES
jgi:Zn-dependent protease with chaperone function